MKITPYSQNLPNAVAIDEALKYAEGRLASKHGQVEFLTILKYIHEFRR